MIRPLLLRVLAVCILISVPTGVTQADDAWPLPTPLTEEEKQKLDRMNAPGTAGTKIVEAADTKNMTAGLSATGAYFGLSFGDEFEKGYAAMFRGDIDETLRILEVGEKEADGWSDFLMFRLTGIKTDVLMRANRALDADKALARAAYFEDEVWSKTWIAETRRGDALARRGEHALAEGDLGRVAIKLGNWYIETHFESMPDVNDIMMRTEAKVRSYLGLASLYTRTGDYPRAMVWANSTEKHFRDLFELASGQYGSMVPIVPDFYIARGEAMAYLGAGVLVVHKDPAKAEPYFAASRGFFKSIGFSYGDAITAAFKAQALYDAGFIDQFHSAAEDAVAAAAKAGLGEIVWKIEALRGQLFYEAGNMVEAEAALRRAQSAVELVSGSLSSDRAKLKFGVGKEKVSGLLVEIDIAKKDYATLFTDLERSRARSFVDMLAGRQVATGREAALVSDIRALDKKILYQRLANASPGVVGEEGLAREQALIAEWSAKNEALRARDPELASVLSISNQTLGDVQGKLGKGDMLAYVLPNASEGDQRLLLVSSKGAKVLSLAVSAEDISDRVEDFTDGVSLEDATEQKTAAKALLSALNFKAWGAKNTLYVVPSGPFYFIPWGALDVKVPVVVLPTGGWIARVPKPVAESKVASVVGDPNFHGELAQLPGARVEAGKIGIVYKTQPLIGDEATEANLRAAIGGGVKILHLATHGIFDVDEPLNSAVMLSGGDKLLPLTAARLFEAPLAAKVVVLSACETGAGKAVAGDDFLGLARSFYIGGALTVVNSLWPIDDKGTLAFMEKFHSIAKTGDYGKAWIGARDHLKKKGFPPSVYGAFVLGGAARS